MYRRRIRGGSSSSSLGSVNSQKFSLSCINSGSDIKRPENTSLIANPSQKCDEEFSDDLPMSVMSCLMSDEDDDPTEDLTIDGATNTIMQAFSQKLQSTRRESHSLGNILKDKNSQNSKEITNTVEKPTKTFQRQVSAKNLEIPSTAPRVNYFIQLLADCGAKEYPGETSFQLGEDQTMFAVKLQKKINSDPSNLNKFIKGVEQFMGTDDDMKKLLVMTQTDSECETARGPVQDAMLRILLHIDCIQTPIIELIEKLLTKLVVNGGNNADQQLIIAILRQVRFVNRANHTNFGSKLIEIIKLSPIDLKKEIIYMIPELVIEEEAEEATTFLIEMLQSNPVLAPIIVDALTNVPLNSSLKDQVRVQILSYLITAPPKHLPLLVKFCVSRCDNREASNIVTSLREYLPFNSNEIVNGGEDTFLVTTFEYLKQSIITSKSMTEAWMKIIAGLTSIEDFQPLDLMMLILIHGFVIGRKSTTITLIKKCIKIGVLGENHITEMFKTLHAVCVEYAKEIIELASSMLKSFEQVIVDITMVIYQESFVHFGSFLRQDLVSDLVNQIQTGGPCTVNAALSILSNLKESNLDILEQYTVSILSTLSRINDLHISCVRKLADLLCCLILSGDREASNAVDEFEIFLRKLMASPILDMQQKGIVCGLMFAKYGVAGNSADVSHANSILRMVMGSRKSSDVRKGFFYDELAMVFEQNTVNDDFREHWKNRAVQLLSQSAFVADVDFQCNNFPMALQYAIDCNTRLVFPITSFVVKPASVGDLSHTLVPSVFRLLWCTTKNPVDILPYLCAAVILPDPEVFDKFLSYDVKDQTMIMDCLFICANYFLECINAFAVHTTGEKVIIRMKQFMEVRELILKYVGTIPNYTPPVCQFHLPSEKRIKKKTTEGKKREPKKSGRGRKRKSDGSGIDSPGTSNDGSLDESIPVSTQSVLPPTAKEPASDAIAQLDAGGVHTHEEEAMYNAYFRSLYCHVLRLLRLELKTTPTIVFKKKKTSGLNTYNISWTYQPEEKPELGPNEILFLLHDYSQKMDMILALPRPAFLSVSKPPGLVYENITPDKFLKKSVKFLPKIYKKYTFVRRHCEEIIEANDGIWDSPAMFNSNFNDMKLIYSAISKIVSDLLIWCDRGNAKYKPILTEILLILCDREVAGTVTTQLPSEEIGKIAAEKLSEFTNSMLLLNGAIHVVKAVQICLKQVIPSEMSLVAGLCDKLLRRPWYSITGSKDSGPTYNVQIDSLLRTYFASVDDKLDMVRQIAEIAADEASILTGKDSSMETFKAISRSNFPLLYRALWDSLISSASESLTNANAQNKDPIDVWAIITTILMRLTDIVKAQTNSTNLSTILKRSQAIIQLFLNKGLPVMETALRVKSDKVLKILKSLQAVTRFLHSICCHSKLTSDGVVGAHVPSIRSLCEKLTLEVKGMLISNKIPLECITIAVLKNRDLRGNDILSQTISGDSEESEILQEMNVDEAQENGSDDDED